MPDPREVEIKFHIHDIDALQSALLASGFRESTPSTHEMNTLYDRGGELKRRGEVLRIRKYGDLWKLTYKAKSGDGGKHKSRIEHETSVASGAAAHAILTALGFAPSFIYEKFRAEWSDGNGHVVIDRTPIGNIAEIEGSPEWIDTTARKLGVAESDYVTGSYATLFLEWKRSSGSAAENMTFVECGVEA